MDKISEFKKLLKEVVGNNTNLPIRGKVKEVNGQTCKVELITGLIVSGVRLKTTVNNTSNYMLITPVINSNVLMLSGNGTLDDLTVIKVDQVQQIAFEINGLKMLLDGNDSKVNIENGQTSLKEILTDQAQIIKGLKVQTPMGASGTPLPDTITAVEQWEIQFNKLLK